MTIRKFLLGLMCLWMVSLEAGTRQIASTALYVHGSAPPLVGLYRCARDMDGKPYDKRGTESCLASILRSHYFEHGDLSTENLADGKILVKFNLYARALVLTEVRFEGPDIDSQQLQTWLDKDPGNSRVGKTYNWDGASGMVPGIKQYFGLRGRLVELSPIVYLDYQNGTARLVFQIVEGPAMIPRPALPPYGPLCEKHIAGEDWSDNDQYTPLPLAKELVKLGPWSCFSGQAAHRDQETLEKSGAFSFAEVRLEGNREYPQVSFVLRGKQLIVDRVDVQTYGQPECTPQVRSTDLPLKSGEIYTRSKAQEALDHLRKLHANLGCTLEVLEHDEMASPGRLRVIFNALAYRQEQVFINGEKVVENEERAKQSD